MKRIALPLGKRLFVVVATLVALVLTLPMRLALGALGLPESGLAARAAEGSVWAGRLVETRIAGVPLGDLHAGVRPLPLLIAQARLNLAGGEGADAMAGALSLSRHTRGVEDLTLHLPAERLFAPLPVRQVGLSDVSVRFRDGICERADGNVQVEMSGTPGGVGLPASFSGAARCEAGALLLPLTAAGGERLTLRLQGDGHYHAEIVLHPGDPTAAAGLTALGFSPGLDGSATLALDGSW